MSYVHEVTKTAKANLERLADSSNAVITYASASECEGTVVERFDGGSGSVTAGTAGSAGGISGTITSQTAKFLFGKKVAGGSGGGPIVEVTTVLAVDGESF